MKFSSSVLLASLAGGVLSQATASAVPDAQAVPPVEPTDFNATAALIDLGVNVSAIPQLDALAQRSSIAGCSIACGSLKLLYGSNVLSQNSAGYNTFQGAYWSLQQSETDPYCIFEPTNALGVSVAILISRLTQCPFAAKSGGHAAFSGASSIQGGITVSFTNMQSISLNSDKSQAIIQPGLVWGDVYTWLAPYNLAVMGGRVYEIGVGGLTTGGGISFFSNIHGWACDNIASYDVITATGAQVNVSPTSFPDLYWSLRGGGNNFGLVVAFHAYTIPLPGQLMWGGTKVYLENSFTQVATAFSSLIADSPQDPNAGQWVAWLSNNGTKIAAAEFWYAQPNGQNAQIWTTVGYNNITAISDTTQNRQLYAYAAEVEQSNPDGLRETYYGLTTKANSQVSQQAKDIFYNNIGALANVAGANPVIIYQGITEGQLAGMSKNGGNPLGLTTANGPYYLIHIACWWENASDDALVFSTITNILTQIKALATSVGAENDYIYMNYASQFEDVIKSYGVSNKAKLQSIAAKYDPSQVFQTLQPGYFKLDGPPVASNYYSG